MAERSPRVKSGRTLTEEEKRVRDEGRRERYRLRQEIGKESPRQGTEGYPGETTEEESVISVRNGPQIGVEDDTVSSNADARARRRRAGNAAEEEPIPTAPGIALDKKGIGTFLNVIDMIMVGRMGEEARMTKDERGMIENGSAELLRKLSPKSAQTLASFSAPTMLLGGVFAYGMRLARISSKRDGRGEDGGSYKGPPRNPQPSSVRPTRENSPVTGVMGETVPRVNFTPANGVPSGPSTGTNGMLDDKDFRRLPDDGAPDGSGIVRDDLADMWEGVAHNG